MDRTPLDPNLAFAELATLSLDAETVESVLQRVAELAKAVLPHAFEVSLTLLTGSDRKRARTVAFTGPLALQLDEAQYADERGPCLDAAEGGSVLHMKDVERETRWPDFVASARTHGAASSLSIPLPVQPAIRAALNIYSLEPDVFDDESVELGKTFASYAAVALANMHLHESTRVLAEQLQSAMASRAVIEQAKGILIAERRISAEAAFDVLVELSQTSNRKLREVAQALVDSALS